MKIQHIPICTLLFTTAYVSFCFGMKPREPKLKTYDFWNSTMEDIQGLTIGILSDVDTTAMSITNKHHWQLVQKQRPARQQAARNRKIDILLRWIVNGELLNGYDFTPFIHQLQKSTIHSESTHYKSPPSNNTIKKCIPTTLVWNKNSTACAFIGKPNDIVNNYLIDILPYNIIELTDIPSTSHVINDSPYFINDNTVAALLRDQHDTSRLKRITSQGIISPRLMIDRAGHLPFADSLHFLANFPYLMQQCAHVATPSSGHTSFTEQSLTCTLKDVKLQGFPVTDSQEKKIRAIILNNGRMPLVSSLKTNQLIEWAIFNLICQNSSYTERCCNQYYYKRPNLPAILRAFSHKIQLIDSTVCDPMVLNECTYGAEQECCKSLESILKTSSIKVFPINNTQYATPEATKLYLSTSILAMPQKSIITIAAISTNNIEAGTTKITATPIEIDPNTDVTHACYTRLNNTNVQDQGQCRVALLLTNTSNKNRVEDKKEQSIHIYTTHTFTARINKHLKDVLRPSTLQKSYPIPSPYCAQKAYFDNEQQHLIHVTMKPDDLIGQLPTLTINTQTNQQEWIYSPLHSKTGI